LRDKPTFQDDFAHRRCLVVADGFYEWKKSASGRKIPYRMRDGPPFAFAGIWEVNAGGNGHPVPGFAIITTTPNAVVEPIPLGCQ
jgi:putative SOS response-associated peptidase YedK